MTQRRGYIGPAAGAENENVVERVAEHVIRPLVEVLFLVKRRHRLVKHVVDRHNRLRSVLDDADAVVGRPEAGTSHSPDQNGRRSEERDIRPGTHPAPLNDEGQRRGEGHAEPGDRPDLQPRHQRKHRDAGKAAGKVQRVGPKRFARPAPAGAAGAARHRRFEFACHPLRHDDEEQRHHDEQDRQQQRALDRHDRLAGAAGKIEAGRAGDGHLEPEPVHGHDHDQLNQGKQREQVAARPDQHAAEAAAEKAGEQNEIGKVREQADVRRHPANQGDLEKKNEKRGEKQAQYLTPSLLRASSGQPFHSSRNALP